MADMFSTFRTGLSDPANDAKAVTPSATAILDQTTRYVYVGASGSLNVVTAAGTTVSFSAVPAGTTIPIRVNRVLATGTSATAIVALW
jgi:hypothetical protein